ncbi:hypothetical protein VTJ83DRAFT_1849 [Remersonia thermophila]|uniref:Uncharacterized protein n=1 Tax=Remersonia thermophila TaxID=72144 RepID=A0ABR4DH37_9PEZI
MRLLLLFLLSPLASLITPCTCRTATTTTTTLTSTALATAIVPSPCPPASSLGAARVRNRCPFPVHLWAVASDVAGPFPLAARTGRYAERFRSDPRSRGISLKIARGGAGALYNAEPHTLLGYNLQPGRRGAPWRVWYGLDDVYGHVFRGERLVLESEAEGCESLVWEDGAAPGGNQTLVCDGADRDLVLTLCA